MADKKTAPGGALSSEVQALGSSLQGQHNTAVPQAPPPPTQSSYDNIPAELRALPQWVAANADKLPINPNTGYAASPTDPAAWGTFQQVCAYAGMHGLRIGFVFTANDPYCVIDLDDKPNKPASDDERKVHARILEQFATYIERSTSGRGYHVILRGVVGPGRRRGNVEVYDRQRYMIFTGDVVRQAPIAECQKVLNPLLAEMPKPAEAGALQELPQEFDDDVIVQRARDADNGEKFARLWAGDWKGAYDSQSNADYALMNFLCLYSVSDEQCRRLFRKSELGKREKAKRKNYVDSMLAKLRAEQAKRQADEDAFIAGIREDVAGWLARAAAKAHPEPWLVPTSELRTRQKPVAWHIKRWLQADALIMVHGPSGAGKTFLVIDWCMRIATGMSDWLGNRVKPGFVVYLAGEGYRGLGSRLQAWAVHHGTAGQAENMVMSRSGCDLDSPDGLARVIDAIRSSGIKPCLIVVDTLHRFMRGDENTAKDAGAMIANCDALKQEFGCSVLLVHHTGVSAEAQQRARGSSAWRGALDVEIGVQPPPAGESAIVVSQLKMRDADPVPPVCVKLEPVDLPGWMDEDDEQVASAVLVEGGALPQKGRPAADFEEKKQHWREAWLAHGTTLLHGEHLAPHLARASLVQWLQEHMNRTPRTAASYLQPGNKSGVIGLLLDKGWLQAHGDGWVCLDAADSSTMMMARNAGVGRSKVGAK